MEVIVHGELKENQNFDTCLRLMKNADYVLLHFTDMLGYLKGRTIPAEQAQNALTDGVTFDGSSMVGGANIEDSDMIMKPDPTTFTVCPHYFYDKSVASLICDVKQPTEHSSKPTRDIFCEKHLERHRQKDTSLQPQLNWSSTSCRKTKRVTLSLLKTT